MFGRAYPHSPSSGRVNNATPTAHTQITPRLLITSGTQMHDFSHRIPLREEGRLLRARDRGFESTFLQRRAHCELAWTRWAHIREFLMQEWWSYLTRCAQQHRNDAQRDEAGHDPSGIGEPAKLHYQQSRHQCPKLVITRPEPLQNVLFPHIP